MGAATASILFDEARASLAHLRRSLGFATLTCLCLGIGVGATSAMFAAIDTLYLAPPSGVQAPARLTRFYYARHIPDGRTIVNDLTSYPSYTDLRDHARGFENVAAFQNTVISEGSGSVAAKLRAILATENYFGTLGVSAAVGRALSKGDGAVAATPAAVISDGLWRRRFGANASVLGQKLSVANRTYTIVGVAPPGFSGIDIEAVDVWLPLELAANDLISPGYMTRRGALAISVVGRLQHDVTAPQIEADATRAFVDSNKPIRSSDPAARVILSPIQRERGPKPSDSSRVAVWLAGVSAAVLLIACVNCAGLLFLRLLGRKQEMALRLALGAGRRQLASMLLIENMLLGAGAALIACGAAAAMGLLLERVLLAGDSGARLVSLPTVCVFAFAVSEGCMLLMTLPMLTRTTVGDLAAALRSGDRVRGTGRADGRALLVVLQVALVSVLLIAAGLFAESFRRARAADLGFDQADAYVVNVDFPGMSGRKSTSLPPQQLARRITEAVRAVPGVSAAGSASSAPFGFTAGARITIPGRDTASMPKTAAWLTVVDDGYAASLGLRLRGGRWLRPSDVDSLANVAVINKTMARTYWPGESALGKCFSDGRPHCVTVVGIVADTRRANIREDPRSQIYEPEQTDQTVPDNLPRSVVFRTTGGQAVVTAVRTAIASAIPSLPFVSIQPMADLAAEKRRPWTLGASMLSLFAAIGLSLAAIGLYGSMSWIVADRSREFAVRLALGAPVRHIASLVISTLGVAVAGGVGIGMFVALYGGRSIQDLLYETSARSQGAFVMAGAAVVIAGAAAAVRPLIRATRISPTRVLREG